ncbi:FAD/NAD-linked reductase [Aspergillus insuetus]
MWASSSARLFRLTAAVTGLSTRPFRELDYKPLWVTVHPPDHPTYYPVGAQMTLRVTFEPVTGRLLGGQAVGKSGVDKRIDVLSTALQGGMSDFDLEHLELGYAPPYGAAKDGINMAGFVGADLLRR